jgi:hypothetical protein
MAEDGELWAVIPADGVVVRIFAVTQLGPPDSRLRPSGRSPGPEVRRPDSAIAATTRPASGTLPCRLGRWCELVAQDRLWHRSRPGDPAGDHAVWREDLVAVAEQSAVSAGQLSANAGAGYRRIGAAVRRYSGSWQGVAADFAALTCRFGDRFGTSAVAGLQQVSVAYWSQFFEWASLATFVDSEDTRLDLP